MDKPYVFISCSSQSQKRALKVRGHLEKQGVSCWMAPDSMNSEETSVAIENCDAFVLLLDQAALRSPWVPREMVLACKKQKPIYPMLWVKELTGDYQFYLGEKRRYSARGRGKESLEQMTRDLLQGLPQIDLSTPQPPQPPGIRKKRILLSIGCAAALLLGVLALSYFGRKPGTSPTEASDTPHASVKNLLCADADTIQPKKTEADEIMEELKDRPVLESKDYRRGQIRSVTFADSLADMPKDAWDVSVDLDGSVMAWVKRQPAVELYDLFIGAEGGVTAPETCDYLFAGYTNLVSITFNGNFHTDIVHSMKGMFAYCPLIRSLNLSGLDTNRVENMNGIFALDAGLNEITLTGLQTPELRSMRLMFYGCESLKRIDISSLQTGKVITMNGLFCDCKLLEHIVFGEGFSSAEAVDMGKMFSGCETLRRLDLSGFDTGKAEDLQGMFYGCRALNTLDLSSFDTDKVKTMQSLFEGCTSLSKIEFGEQFSTANVTDLSFMFRNCESLSEIPGLNGFNTDKVKTMESLFDGCASLSKIEFGEQFTTENVTDLSFMFCNCASLSEIPDLNRFNTEKVQTMQSMFNGCTSLTKLEFGEQFTTAEVTNMNFMFSHCETLTKLDLRGFDTRKVQDMGAMFQFCINLVQLRFEAQFITEEVTDMGFMFDSCESLTELDLSGFDTGKVWKMRAMFQSCINLTHIDFGERFTTAEVTDAGYMFWGCKSLQTLDLRCFDTAKMEKMDLMFGNCSNLEELQSSDTFVIPEGAFTLWMFSGCDKLTDNELYQQVNGTVVAP